jgi:hypothetical protein
VACAEQFLAASLVPGDMVGIDNLSCRKWSGVRDLITGAGCRPLRLPPYSPDLGPIKLAIGELKALLCWAGRRTVDGVWSILGQALGDFGPRECLRLLGIGPRAK